MIINKDINLSEDDIVKETNLEKLLDWKIKLQGIISSILTKSNVENWHLLPPRAKSAYRYNYTLFRMVRTRYASLLETKRQETGYRSERARKRDRTLYAKFMEVAKREMDKSEYKRILSIAQQELANERE